MMPSATLTKLARRVLRNLQNQIITGARRRPYVLQDAIFDAMTEYAVVCQANPIDDSNFVIWLNAEDQSWHRDVLERGQALATRDAANFLSDGRLSVEIERQLPLLYLSLLQLEERNRRDASQYTAPQPT
jgi:hypothetical protein